jgi:hypothetical protein
MHTAIYNSMEIIIVVADTLGIVCLFFGLISCKKVGVA